MTAGAVVVDLSAVQSPDYRGRGVGRRAYEEAAALERTRPDLVGAYLLDPDWPPPGVLDEIVSTGKVHYSGTPAAVAACERAAVFHCPSPIELGRRISHVRPPFVDHLGMRYSVTVHDLIPLHERDRYLDHPAQRRRYVARLEVLRAADAVLAVSGKAAADASRDLGISPARCHAVGSGVSARFAPPASKEDALAALILERPEIDGPFVLFPAGSDPRKNVEGLIHAFSLLPERARLGLGLVILGDYPDNYVAHYRHLAQVAGIGRPPVLPGFVSDEALLLCYQAASLVVFPSLAEGFGLPVAEALAAGTPCCVSDRPPLDELVTDPRARFDPTQPSEIAAVMARCLDDETLRASLVTDGARSLSSWDDVARRVSCVWDELARGPRRPWRHRRRPRLAVVSPFPPIPSGIAGYSANLVASIERIMGDAVEVDCFVDGRDRYPVSPDPIGGRRPRDAALFERVDGAIGGFDHVLYVLGNSECHANALAALRRRPGTVLAHEVRLSGLLSFSAHTRGAAPGGLEAAIARNYPGLPQGLGRDGRVHDADAERYGLLLLKDIAGDAERVLVCSESARRLAILDVGVDLADRIGVVPFAVTRRSDLDAAVAAVGAGSNLDARPLVAAFGVVDPSKRTDALIETVAVLARRGVDVRGALVGPVSEELRRTLASLATSLGVGDRMVIVGEVSQTDYQRLLGEATVAVQLRDRSSGECSGTVSECLTAGVPTVVTSIGWMAEIPRTAVVAVPQGCGAEALADVVGGLLGTAAERERLGTAGRDWAAQWTYDVAAGALLETLGVREPDTYGA